MARAAGWGGWLGRAELVSATVTDPISGRRRCRLAARIFSLAREDKTNTNDAVRFKKIKLQCYIVNNSARLPILTRRFRETGRLFRKSLKPLG